MSIEFICGECGKRLRVPEASAGEQARCPSCGNIQTVPSAPPTNSPPTAPVSSNPFADAVASPPNHPIASDATNPYAAPTATSQGLFGRGSRIWARTCVEGPARLLKAVAGFALVFSMLGVAINLIEFNRMESSLELFAFVLQSAVLMMIYGTIFVGANCMKQLKNYRLAIAASILAMLPCNGCCVLGLPVGIWSLLVLSNADIRAAFR